MYKHYKWGNQYGSGYKVKELLEISASVRGAVNGKLMGKISCNEKNCTVSTSLSSKARLSVGAKVWGWGVGASWDHDMGEISLPEEHFSSPLNGLRGFAK